MVCREEEKGKMDDEKEIKGIESHKEKEGIRRELSLVWSNL